MQPSGEVRSGTVEPDVPLTRRNQEKDALKAAINYLHARGTPALLRQGGKYAGWRKPGSECTFKDKRPETLCPKNTKPKPLAARLWHRRCKPVELISSPSPLRKARCPLVDFLRSADCNDQATPDSGVAKHRAGIGAIDSRLALRSENLSSLIPTRT